MKVKTDGGCEGEVEVEGVSEFDDYNNLDGL